MWRYLHIWYLKRKARQAERRFSEILAEFHCGQFLACFISPRASQAKRDYEQCLNELRKVDPNFPKGERNV